MVAVKARLVDVRWGVSVSSLLVKFYHLFRALQGRSCDYPAKPSSFRSAPQLALVEALLEGQAHD